MRLRTGKALVGANATRRQTREAQSYWICLLKRSCAGEYTWKAQSIQKMDMAQPKWSSDTVTKLIISWLGGAS